MTVIQRFHGALFGLLAAAATASAQTPVIAPSGDEWTRGTTLNVFAGAAAVSGDRAVTAGGAFGWELTPRLALEASGTWLDWGHGADAFTATMTAQAALRTARPLVPYLAVGMGVYHASFNQFDAAMPRFYHRRMMGAPLVTRMTATFTDPSLVAGGGVNVYVSRHWTIRPELMANVVLRDARTFVATTGAVRLAYHFENHPTTPHR